MLDYELITSCQVGRNLSVISQDTCTDGSLKLFYHEAISCNNSKNNIYCIAHVTVNSCKALGWSVCLAELCWRIKFVSLKQLWLLNTWKLYISFLATDDAKCILKYSVVIDEAHKNRSFSNYLVIFWVSTWTVFKDFFLALFFPCTLSYCMHMYAEKVGNIFCFPVTQSLLQAMGEVFAVGWSLCPFALSDAAVPMTHSCRMEKMWIIWCWFTFMFSLKCSDP